MTWKPPFAPPAAEWVEAISHPSIMDASKAKRELGWKPRYTNFRDGLAATIDWYRANEDWWRPLKYGVEAAYAAGGQ